MTRSTQPAAPAGVAPRDAADVTTVDDADAASGVRARRSTLAEPGALVGDKYRLVAPLGQGGTGTVWLAWR